MKNKEKFCDILMDLLVRSEKVAISSETGKPCSCSNCLCCDCSRMENNGCNEESLREWLEEEYEPKVDWSKVPVDTRVYVRDLESQEWIPRYFAEYRNDRIYVWLNGATSYSAKREDKVGYFFAKLAEEEENEID